jgi:hypothetical protein
LERNKHTDEYDCPGTDARAANALYNSANDESIVGRSRGTNNGSDLKYWDESDQNPLCWVIGVDKPERQLESTKWEEEAWLIPSYISEAVELVRDSRYSCTKYGSILYDDQSSVGDIAITRMLSVMLQGYEDIPEQQERQPDIERP